jgi:hypothetical protein
MINQAESNYHHIYGGDNGEDFPAFVVHMGESFLFVISLSDVRLVNLLTAGSNIETDAPGKFKSSDSFIINS